MATKTRRTGKRFTGEARERMQREALQRAQEGSSTKNDEAVINGFIDKGIPEEDIQPRENVYSFNAWKALGRSVKPGEHGVQIFTILEVNAPKDQDTDNTAAPTDATDDDNAPGKIKKKKTVTVFHISQTETEAERTARIEAQKARAAANAAQQVTQWQSHTGSDTPVPTAPATDHGQPTTDQDEQESLF